MCNYRLLSLRILTGYKSESFTSEITNENYQNGLLCMNFHFTSCCSLWFIHSKKCSEILKPILGKTISYQRTNFKHLILTDCKTSWWFVSRRGWRSYQCITEEHYILLMIFIMKMKNYAKQRENDAKTTWKLCENIEKPCKQCKTTGRQPLV